MKQPFSTRFFSEIPQVLYCEREDDLPAGATFGPVIRDVYIFECCTEGYGAVTINEREFPVSPGDCYVLLPGDSVIHKADEINPRKGFWFAAAGLQIGHLLSRAGIDSAHPFAPREVFQEIREQMEALLSASRESDPGSPLRACACLYGILGAMLRKGADTDRDAVIQKAVGMMESRYHDPITTEGLAAFVGLERSYFSTFFKSRTGMGPHRYLTRLRIQKACALMDQGQNSVSVVAESVGLDPQNFARLFKRETGLTPLEYRKNREGRD